MAYRFCRNCGNELRPSDKFCPNCGQAVDEAVDETAVAPTPEADVPTPTPPPQQQSGWQRFKEAWQGTLREGPRGSDPASSVREAVVGESQPQAGGPLGTVVRFLGAGGVLLIVLILIIFFAELPHSAGAAFAFLLVAGGVVILAVLINGNRLGYASPRVVAENVQRCLEGASAHMAANGYAISYRGENSITFSKQQSANVGVGCLLLLLGLIPGILYFGLFRGTSTTTLTATPTAEGTRLDASGDQSGRINLNRWMKTLTPVEPGTGS